MRALLVAVVALLVLAADASAQTYDRKQWKHWIDADKDCQDTRQEVLIRQSSVPVTLDKKGCRVLAGVWYDLYTGRVFTDPKDLQIDHRISLQWAFKHGGYAWDAKKREQFANDLDNPEHLIAVYGPANQAKGSLGPAEWRPENKAHWCDHGKAFASITYRYGLFISWDDLEAVIEMTGTCPVTE